MIDGRPEEDDEDDVDTDTGAIDGDVIDDTDDGAGDDGE